MLAQNDTKYSSFSITRNISLLKLKTFDISKILCIEIKNGKILQLSYLGEFEKQHLLFKNSKTLLYWLCGFHKRNVFSKKII